MKAHLIFENHIRLYSSRVFLGLLAGTLIQLILPFLSQAILDKGINGYNIQLICLILIAQVLLTIGSVFWICQKLDFFIC